MKKICYENWKKIKTMYIIVNISPDSKQEQIKFADS